jgi:hypothetical protein
MVSRSPEKSESASPEPSGSASSPTERAKALLHELFFEKISIKDSLSKLFKGDDTPRACSHGVTFDPVEAAKILDGWQPGTPAEFIAGNPGSREVRKRWPRLDGPCPLGCGYVGIYYASYEHYTAGDW